MQDVSSMFGEIPDPQRMGATRHDLHDMLMIALPCIIPGAPTPAPTCRTVAGSRRISGAGMGLKHGIPGHDAFSDLFNHIDPHTLHAASR